MIQHLLESRFFFFWCGTVLTIFYSLNFFLADCQSFLSLVTANTLITHTYVWNLLTSSFYESNIIKLIIDLLLLWFISGKIGQPSIEQFGLYFIFSILAATIGTSILGFLRFVSTGQEYPLITPSYGFFGILIMFFMYLRYKLGGQPLHNSFFPSISYHHLPVCLPVCQTVGSWLGLKTILCQDITFTYITLIFSWSYLKFYYRYSEQELPGEHREDFAFVAMFPEAVHIVLVPFTTAFYNIMALLTLFPPLETAYTTSSNNNYHHLRPIANQASSSSAATAGTAGGAAGSAGNSNSNSNPVLSKADAVAERRRARAIKMLDAKMAELASRDTELGWDDISMAEAQAAVRAANSNTPTITGSAGESNSSNNIEFSKYKI